jgi:hypothetical protein
LQEIRGTLSVDDLQIGGVAMVDLRRDKGPVEWQGIGRIPASAAGAFLNMLEVNKVLRQNY